jgi:hypothetical protein
MTRRKPTPTTNNGYTSHSRGPYISSRTGYPLPLTCPPLVALASSNERLRSPRGALRRLVVQSPGDLSAAHSHFCHEVLYRTLGPICFEIDG